MTGLMRKYKVTRVDGRDAEGGDKANARYFVLDYVNDPYAFAALAFYANACEREYPDLAADLRVQRDRVIAARSAAPVPGLPTDKDEQ